jgi:hypothetical protein
MSDNFAAPLNTAAHTRQTHDAHGRSASEWSAAPMGPSTGEWSGVVSCRNRCAGKGFRMQTRTPPSVLAEPGIPAR